MAFECQECTEVSKNLDNCEKDSCLEQIEAQHINISTLDCHHKNCIKSSYTAKQSPCNNVLSGCRLSITDLPPALISEILNCLDPKELGVVSCVSPILYRLASEHRVWKEFYSERWGLPIVPTSMVSDEKSWKELFVQREFRSKTFLGRHSIEALFGHTEAVRTVFLLASAKLIFTSGYDSVVRMWDMEEGLSIASSRPLGCTIRAVAADTKLLIAGGTEGFIHCWRAVEGLPCLFDLRGAEAQNTESRLWEHEGPVTSLALDLTSIYSGSWDMAVRVWDRASLKCLKVLRHGDWVWSLAPHDTTVASASGSDVYVWETKKGIPLGVIHNAHDGNIYSLARSHTGDFIFTGGEDGAIHMFEMTSHCVKADIVRVATWIPHSGPVYSLAFEFPWLVSASSDGTMSLIDVRTLLRTRRRSLGKNAMKFKHANPNSLEPPQRMLHGFGANLFSVDIGADRIICGGEEGVVRIWNFSQALEIEQRARTQRGRRLENRMRRKLQIDMNRKGAQTDQCSVSAKNNSMHGDRSAWHNKRGMSRKLKA
ncbi:F-box/WD-40 repeat-containing protein At5g21040-like [Tripterygium wilfordii]|uniref:F-box/WD-40 repeat-containing protein At5g21040-like n=1 Tax=Tripterygium wilfordii TaxID=458696 RepID=UPI0018F85FC8|nr:F-box/WD-40 repeat-containing protein At5g21040-like [Tripterygium wilfordii]